YEPSVDGLDVHHGELQHAASLGASGFGDHVLPLGEREVLHRERDRRHATAVVVVMTGGNGTATGSVYEGGEDPSVEVAVVGCEIVSVRKANVHTVDIPTLNRHAAVVIEHHDILPVVPHSLTAPLLLQFSQH